MSPCPKAENGAHVWRSLGRCYHSHSTGGNDYEALECEVCGALAHRGPLSFACGERRRTAVQVAEFQAAERESCPITRRKRERAEQGAQP